MKKIITNISKRPIIVFFCFVGTFLVLTGILLNSYALIETIDSISFTSTKLSYEKKEPGSLKIVKSARWISSDKVRITFDVDSILKRSTQYTDTILVLDLSYTMNGEKLDRLKEELIQLINELLSDSNNQVALITFSTDFKIVSKFTNNKDILVSQIQSLTTSEERNHYQALVGVDSLLKSYRGEESRDCSVLFVTDGHPNRGFPNEIVEYNYLKKEYPYLTIKGIQYAIGEEILNSVKNISDYQYTATLENIGDILYEASVSFVPYDNFILTDWINSTYFTINELSDIEASIGTVSVDNDDTGEKVVWEIKKLQSGTKPKLMIEISLKPEYKKQKGLYSTNKKEEVTYNIGETKETFSSIQTPILTNYYQVIYDENQPHGCTVEGMPSNSLKRVFDIVKMDDQVPSCSGYQFQGWKIITENVRQVNTEYFEMPEKNITIRAEWSKLSIVKSMFGTINTVSQPIIQSVNETYELEFWKYRDSITKVVFEPTGISVIGATEQWDISQAKDGSVMAYLVPNNNSNTQTVYIQGSGGVIANTDSSSLFYHFSKLVSIEGLEFFDTSSSINMHSMFHGCSSLIDLDLSNFDTSKVESMGDMFHGCISLVSLNLSSFNTSNVQYMYGMFTNCNSLSALNISNFDTTKVINMSGMFTNCRALTTLDLRNFITSNVTDMTSMFMQCTNLVNLYIDNFDTSKVTSMNYMFNQCSNLSVLDLRHFTTKNVTNMEGMFGDCTNLTSVNLNSFDTSKVTNMKSMFSGCSHLLSIDVSNFITSSVIEMSGMFSDCAVTLLDLSNFNTENVIDMSHMFWNCIQLTSINLSSFSTNKVTDMTNMFANCANITNLNLDNFDTSNVTSMMGMFTGCAKLEILNLERFNTSKVTNMNSMFSGCSKLVTLNVNSFDTSNVTDMSMMFAWCTILKVMDTSQFNTTKVINASYMFAGCHALSTTINLSFIATTSFDGMFQLAAALEINSDAEIVVNYTENLIGVIDNIIDTKSNEWCNVIKGTEITL